MQAKSRSSGKIDRAALKNLQDLPNVGPATAGDLRLLDIDRPSKLIGRDPYALYDQLCKKTGQRHDPCVIDVFISVVRFMEGAPPHPWWKYTAERKRAIAVRDPRPSATDRENGDKGTTSTSRRRPTR